jgi:transcriptional regulator of arginine metabolism
MTASGRKGVKAALRELLSTGFAGTQEDISAALKERGVEVNQSTVSRALKRLGAIKQADGENVVYRLPRDVSRANYTGSIEDLVLSVDHNETTVIIRTVPGSASFVGEFLDHANMKHMMGSIAGDDTLFIAPRSTSDIQSTLDEIARAIAG